MSEQIVIKQNVPEKIVVAPYYLTLVGGLSPAEADRRYVTQPAGASKGQVLMHNGTGWVSSNITLAGLTDVQIASMSEGDLLSYSPSLSKWINAPKTTVTDGGNF